VFKPEINERECRVEPNPGFEAKGDMDFSSITRLRRVCAGAKMDEELFGYLCNPETRERLRAVLIEVV
jgi:hypothetical protein